MQLPALLIFGWGSFGKSYKKVREESDDGDDMPEALFNKRKASTTKWVLICIWIFKTVEEANRISQETLGRKGVVGVKGTGICKWESVSKVVNHVNL